MLGYRLKPWFDPQDARKLLNLTETLCELIAIPSVNPMGRGLCGPEYL